MNPTGNYEGLGTTPLALLKAVRLKPTQGFRSRRYRARTLGTMYLDLTLAINAWEAQQTVSRM